MFEGELRIEHDERHLRLIANPPDKLGAALVTITTTFDRESSVVHREWRIFSGLWRSSQSFPYKEIRGIGLKHYRGDIEFSASCLPAITLRNGKRRTLAVLNARAEVYGPTVDALCTATGFPRIDHPGNIWGW